MSRIKAVLLIVALILGAGLLIGLMTIFASFLAGV